jgi:hypothetical protein
MRVRPATVAAGQPEIKNLSPNLSHKNRDSNKFQNFSA